MHGKIGRFRFAFAAHALLPREPRPLRLRERVGGRVVFGSEWSYLRKLFGTTGQVIALRECARAVLIFDTFTIWLSTATEG
jgi:hypothetical protein